MSWFKIDATVSTKLALSMRKMEGLKLGLSEMWNLLGDCLSSE